MDILTSISGLLTSFSKAADAQNPPLDRRRFLKGAGQVALALSSLPLVTACGPNLTAEQKAAMQAETAREREAAGLDKQAQIDDPTAVDAISITDPKTGEELIIGFMLPAVEIEKGLYLPRQKIMYDGAYRVNELGKEKVARNEDCLKAKTEAEKRTRAREARQKVEREAAERDGKTYEISEKDKVEAEEDKTNASCDPLIRFTSTAGAEAYAKSLPAWKQRENEAKKQRATEALVDQATEKLVAARKAGNKTTRFEVDMNDLITRMDWMPNGQSLDDYLKRAMDEAGIADEAAGIGPLTPNRTNVRGSANPATRPKPAAIKRPSAGL